MNAHFFTSDLHLNHKNIPTYCPETRPFRDVTEMNAGIIAAINAVVRPDDELHILGDVALGPKGDQHDLIAQINGRKHLYLGNHDRSRRVYTEEWSDLFVSVQTQGFIHFAGRTFWLAHVPSDNSLDDRDLNRPTATQPYDYELCGHVHGKWKMRNGILNVGWDIWQRPITFKDINNAYA